MTKKGISGLWKRKNKGKEEAPANIAPSKIESKPPQTPEEISDPEITNENTTCPNDRCGRTFGKSLELIDLANPTEQSSHVCPYCLTKIEPAQPEPELELEQEAVTEILPEEKFQDTEPKEGKCPKFVGYLSKRPKNTPIPEFCLTCPQMMECLLG